MGSDFRIARNLMGSDFRIAQNLMSGDLRIARNLMGSDFRFARNLMGGDLRIATPVRMMRTNWLDILLTLWVMLVAAEFSPRMLLGVGIVESELVTRCIYLCVLAVGLFGLAIRIFRVNRR